MGRHDITLLIRHHKMTMISLRSEVKLTDYRTLVDKGKGGLFDSQHRRIFPTGIYVNRSTYF